MKKRFLRFIAILLVLSFIPATAYAAHFDVSHIYADETEIPDDGPTHAPPETPTTEPTTSDNTTDTTGEQPTGDTTAEQPTGDTTQVTTGEDGSTTQSDGSTTEEDDATTLDEKDLPTGEYDGDNYETITVKQSYTTTKTVILTEEQLIAKYGKTYSSKKSETENALAFLNSLMMDQNTFIESLQEMDELIIAYDNKINALLEEQAEIQQAISDTEAALTEAEAEEAKRYQTLKSHIRSNYEAGDIRVIEALIEADGFTDLMNRIEYITSVNAYDNKALNDVVERRRKIEDKRALLNSAQQDIADLTKDYSDTIEAANLVAEHKKLQIQKWQDEIDDQQKVFDDLQEELNQMIVDTETSTRFVYTTTKKYVGDNAKTLLWPCPVSTTISSHFGYRDQPLPGASTYHQGIDIPCPIGSPVLAIADGQIMYVGYMGTGGFTVMVDHGNGFVAVYHHLSSTPCEVGDIVKAGDIAAFSGNTGNSTGPHLHFGIRINGAYVDPLQFYKV